MSLKRLNLVFVVPDDVPQEELRKLLAMLAAMNPTLKELLPTVASESTWRCWRELSPFDGAAVAATGQTLIGATARREAAPSLASLRRGVEVQYASLLPLKNNWRLSRGRPPARTYAHLVNHAKGCASALTGRVVTAPAALEFTSTQEGYFALVEGLTVLRASLSS
jgi:hypothetical protein